MLAGITVQLVAITLYIIVAIEFAIRYLSDTAVYKSAPSEDIEGTENSEKDRLRGILTGRLKLMALALGISTLFIFM